MADARNDLIWRLPRRDRERLLGVCEPFELVLGDIVCEPGEPIHHIYFPTEGFISLIALIEGSRGVEVGMVGTEGLLGAQIALGVAVSPVHALVQGAGSALRVSARVFARELEASPALRRALNRYLYVLMTQLITATACLRFHMIEPRLARWLLMSQDRAGSPNFRVTHESLAYMLGVRRVGITVAASALQRSGLIEYSRGDLAVLDRKGLESAACNCYAANLKAYAGLMR